MNKEEFRKSLDDVIDETVKSTKKEINKIIFLFKAELDEEDTKLRLSYEDIEEEVLKNNTRI